LALANLPIHVLQSQYIIIKALQHCTTAYWKHHHEQNPAIPGHAFRPELQGYPQTWASPPAIEESLARFMVNILLLYVRMTTYEVTAAQTGVRGRTAPVPGTFGIKGENDQTPMGRSMLRFLHGFSTSADVGLKYRTEKSMEGKADAEGPGGLMTAPDGTEGRSPASPGLNRSPRLGHRRPQSTHSISTVSSASGSTSASSLMCEIARQTGKIFYFLSSASWSVVYSKIKSTLVKLGQSNEDHPDAVEIRILEWVNLDQAKLSLVIKGMIRLG
jgi:neurofibromin 1